MNTHLQSLTTATTFVSTPDQPRFIISSWLDLETAPVIDLIFSCLWLRTSLNSITMQLRELTPNHPFVIHSNFF